MKTRAGFVSNSSSSSFIIIGDVDKITCPVCKGIIQKYEVQEYTPEDYCIDYIGYSVEDALDDEDCYNKEFLKDCIENNKKIRVIEVEYDDDEIVEEILKEHKIEYIGN